MYDVSRAIMINGVPRSGTSWLGHIFDSHINTLYRFQPFYSWEFKGLIHEDMTPNEIMRLFHQIAGAQSSFVLEGLNYHSSTISKLYPDVLVMKHVRFHNLLPMFVERIIDKLKVVFITRDPRSILVSWANAQKEVVSPVFGSFDEWYFGTKKNSFKPENFYGFNKWKEFCNLVTYLLNTYPDNCVALRYEDLIVDPYREIERVFGAVDLYFHETTSNYIASSTRYTLGGTYSTDRDISEIRSRSVLCEIPPSINDRILMEITGTPLERFLDENIK